MSNLWSRNLVKDGPVIPKGYFVIACPIIEIDEISFMLTLYNLKSRLVLNTLGS